jgi:hypothetical protein
MGLFERKITEDTDLESVSTKRLLKEHRRLVLQTTDPAIPGGFAVGLASDIEDVLERRGEPFPSATEIAAEERR